MRAESGKKGKGKKKRKEKEKGGKNGDQNHFVFFYKSTRRFFHMRSGHFSNI